MLAWVWRDARSVAMFLFMPFACTRTSAQEIYSIRMHANIRAGESFLWMAPVIVTRGSAMRTSNFKRQHLQPGHTRGGMTTMSCSHTHTFLHQLQPQSTDRCRDSNHLRDGRNDSMQRPQPLTRPHIGISHFCMQISLPPCYTEKAPNDWHRRGTP